MSLGNLLTEKVILPFSDFVFRQNIAKSLKFLNKSQWWTSQELKDFQNEKLRELIKHAYKNVPYYNELFKLKKLTPEDIQTTDDLLKLPLLTKEIIKANFPDKIVAFNIPKTQKILMGSSGSTGEPVQYYITKKAFSFKTACNLRGLYWHGFRLGDKHCKLSTNPRTSLRKKIQDKITRCNYISSQGVTQLDLIQNVEDLVNYNPKMIYGYPSTLSVLANYIEKNGINIIRPSFINTHGEILFPHQKELIERVFKCSVIDAYSGEGGAITFECITRKAYHVSDEYAITEVINNSERINSVGEGDIVTTDLWNYAVPMIRYNIKDVGVIKDEKCSCGRGLSLIHKIKGRDSDILVTPSGKYLIVHFFTGFFEWIPSVDQFQVIQNEPDKIELLLKINDQFNDTVKDKILTEIQKYIGNDVKLKLKFVDEIPLTRSGKRRFMIRNIAFNQ